MARRAGTTAQTVLRIYGSKQALALLAMEASTDCERAPTPPGDIAAAVKALYDDYDVIGDQVIRYLAEEPRRPALGVRVEAGRRAHRRWVAAAFAPQLAARSGRARNELLHALILATDVYAWKILVRDLRLGRRGAERITKVMLSSLLDGGDHGKDPVGLLGWRRKPDAEPGRRPRAARATIGSSSPDAPR